MLEVICSTGKYLKIIEFEYNEPQFFVNLDGGRSANHVQHTGIRQGCTLSPFLFLLVMQIIMELVENEVNEKRLEDKFKMKSFNQLEIFSLLFADDTLIFAENAQGLDILLKAIEKHSRQFGLILNKDKCCQVIKSNTDILPSFEDGTEITQDSSAVYLGTEVTDDTKSKAEVIARINKASCTWHTMHRTWLSTKISIKDKVVIYNSLISSKLLYGLESLTLDYGLYNRLDAFLMKGWRKILAWKSTFFDRSKTNKAIREEICKHYKKDLKLHSTTVKERAVKLLGETIRRGEEHIAYKAVFNSDGMPNLPDKRRVGMPRLVWANETAKIAWRQHVSTMVDFNHNSKKNWSIIHKLAIDNKI